MPRPGRTGADTIRGSDNMTLLVCLRSASARGRRIAICALAFATLALATPASFAANRTWIAVGSGTWNEGAGNDANWNPADEPDFDDAAIFNSNVDVMIGTANTINGLTMSASAELLLDGNTLTVAGATSLTGSGTRLEVEGTNAALVAQGIVIDNTATLTVAGTGTTLAGQSVAVNANATFFVDGGAVTLQIAGAPTGTISIAGTGTVSGNGTISFPESIVGTVNVIDNNGTISASNPVAIILTPPAAATLALTATDVDARIDLDGSVETGVVIVGRNQTLDVNIPLVDIFNGDITMAQNSKLDISTAWILGANALFNVDNGATGGIGGAPAGTATIAGASFSQNSGTITVADPDGTLQFDAPFTLNGGTLSNNGLVVFNSSTTIAAAANFTMPTTFSSLTVAANGTVNINQANFNLDGANAATNVITVGADAALNITTGDYDPDSATNAFDGTINLTSATININTADAEFVMDGVLNSTASGANQSLWTGEAVAFGNDAGVLDADVNISGSQPTQFGAQVRFNSDADLNVANGATAHFLALVNFNSVNAANNAQFTGAGEIIFSAGVNFTEATHLNFVGGTVDLDGADSVGDTLNVDAPLTINAELVRSFGRPNGGGGTNLLDVNNSVNAGTLTVILDDPNAAWTLNAQGVMNLVNDNTAATLLAGNDLNLNGTVNVTGDVRTTSRLDIGSTAVININTAAEPLRLAGGTTNDHNTISGATISGVGLLGADTARALHGYGTINATIDFDGTANLRADNGTLTINGAINDVNIIGTDDEDGVLNIPAAWNNSVAAAVSMLGGTLQGGTITNDTGNGIQGFGTVTARVINNTQLLGGNGGGTLLFETAGNDNDWDGTTNTGELIANAGALLELRDVGAAFAFGGRVSAAPGGRVFTNGFALDFNPGSQLVLSSSTYESTNSTDIGGTVTIEVGGLSTIKVENNRFLSFEAGSATTLNSNLRLLNNNIIIKDGATFAGAGALIVPDGSHMVIDNAADVGVLLEMYGALRPGNSQGIGAANLTNYQQYATGELFLEIKGTSLNAFDRLAATGVVIVDGYLNIDIDEIAPMVPFVPVLGNTFNIVTGSSVTGQFDYYDVSGMPPGLAFKINYLANAVQLQVVNEPFFSADFDDDGDVDLTDLSIWKGAFNLNQLGDANGDNISNGADFLLWQQQLGSKPTAVAASGNVPEPTALTLLATVLLATIAARQRSSDDCR
jgi:hypothetical protein